MESSGWLAAASKSPRVFPHVPTAWGDYFGFQFSSGLKISQPVGISDVSSRTYDLSTLEDLLIDQLEKDGSGVLDGHEFGPENTVIYLYGANAERIFAGIRPILAGYPLCENSEVTISRGGPGSDQRVERIGVAGKADR